MIYLYPKMSDESELRTFYTHRCRYVYNGTNMVIDRILV